MDKISLNFEDFEVKATYRDMFLDIDAAEDLFKEAGLKKGGTYGILETCKVLRNASKNIKLKPSLRAELAYSGAKDVCIIVVRDRKNIDIEYGYILLEPVNPDEVLLNKDVVKILNKILRGGSINESRHQHGHILKEDNNFDYGELVFIEKDGKETTIGQIYDKSTCEEIEEKINEVMDLVDRSYGRFEVYYFDADVDEEDMDESRRPRGRMLREYREDNYTHCFKIWKDGDISGIRLFKGTISDIAFYFRLGFHPYDMHELLSALDKKGVSAYEIHDSQYYSNKDHLERVDLS